jgi:hypothetical protein
MPSAVLDPLCPLPGAMPMEMRSSCLSYCLWRGTSFRLWKGVYSDHSLSLALGFHAISAALKLCYADISAHPVSQRLAKRHRLVWRSILVLVCGEPCASQICPLCADEDKKEWQVVDVIMGRTLGEFDPKSNDLRGILITLDCRHTFTVESLDGVCELSKHYEGTDGKWASPAPPPQGGLQQLPKCPSCRAPIRSLRYGRIFKRANLDLSDRVIPLRQIARISQVSEPHFLSLEYGCSISAINSAHSKAGG